MGVSQCLSRPNHLKTFSRHLAEGIETADGTKSWVTILTEAAEEQTDPEFRDALKQAIDEVKVGHSFYRAVSNNPNAFGEEFTAMLRHGERNSTSMDKILHQYSTGNWQDPNKNTQK